MTTPTGNPPASNPPANPPTGTTNPPTNPPSSTPANPPEPSPTPTAPKAGERVVPETYDLKLPKETSLDDKALTRVVEFAKANRLTQEEAAAHLEFLDKEIAARKTQAEESWNGIVDGWEKAAKEDKEIGGANFEKSSRLAAAVVKKFGTPELVEALNAGYGNHPELIRLLSRIGAQFTEDELLTPPPGGEGTRKDKSTADVLYGSTTPT